MLEAVGHPRAVNPDRALRKIARERHWPVLAFGARSPADRDGVLGDQSPAGANLLEPAVTTNRSRLPAGARRPESPAAANPSGSPAAANPSGSPAAARPPESPAGASPSDFPVMEASPAGQVAGVHP